MVYLGYPLVAFVVRFITSPQRGFHVPGLFPALWISLSGATVSLAIVTVLGVPLAYLLARSSGPIATIVGTIVQIPLALPPLMSGIVLVNLIGRTRSWDNSSASISRIRSWASSLPCPSYLRRS